MSLKCDQSLLTAIKESRDRQLLLPVADLNAQWKRKAKRNFTVSVKTPKATEEEATLKSTTGMASLRGSAR
jgi:hypothetical protein